MSNILIHKANELKPATRAALEAELGRSLGDDEDVSIMPFPAHDPPVDEARMEVGRKLEGYFARIDSRRPDVPDEEADTALDEALKAILGTALAGRAEFLCTLDADLREDGVRMFARLSATQIVTDLELLSLL
jgi:hypothetical protein